MMKKGCTFIDHIQLCVMHVHPNESNLIPRAMVLMNMGNDYERLQKQQALLEV